MNTLELLLIAFGVIPIVIIFLQKFIFGFLPTFGIGRFYPHIPVQTVETWYHIPGEAVPWSPIKRSFIQKVSRTLHAITYPQIPQFHTLRCSANSVGDGKWLISVVFEVWNPPVGPEIIIDDLHARLFEKDAFAPPLATISYFGDVWLRQDNSILKDRRDYSLKPGDGYQINLVFRATRIEAAPAYGMSPIEKEGQLLVIFGLLVDYYWHHESTLKRAVMSSDCVYVFNSSGLFQGQTILPVDSERVKFLKSLQHSTQETVQFIKRLEGYVIKNSSFQPIPRM